MKVLVDTCIWSLALRGNKQPASNIEVVELQELIEEVRVQLTGPIRQEILSGVKRRQQFSTCAVSFWIKLSKSLFTFIDLLIKFSIISHFHPFSMLTANRTG